MRLRWMCWLTGRQSANQLAVGTLLIGLLSSFGCQRESRLKEFSVPAAGFAVKMPGSPEKETRAINGAKTTAFSVKEEKGYFSVLYKKGPEINNPTKDELQGYFAEWRDNFLASTGGKLKKEAAANLDDKNPGQFYEIEVPQKHIKQQVRAILANGNTYSLMAVGLTSWPSWAEAEVFFNSFRLVEK